MIRNISVILPAKNEAANLANIIPAILEKYDKYILEVIIVDDCSTDKTLSIIRLIQVKYPKVKLTRRRGVSGVGLAIKEGILNIAKDCEYVLFMDCDFIVNVPDVANFIQEIDSYDGVVGSRFIKKDSLKNYPKVKLMANRSYHFLAKILLGVKQSDLTNNFKLYRRELVNKIFPLLSSRDFAINAEMGFYPLLLGASIGQVPVSWQERTKHMGLSKFKILQVGPSYAYIFLKLIWMKLGYYDF